MHLDDHRRFHTAGAGPQAASSRHWRYTRALILAVVTAVATTLLTLALLAPASGT